MTTRRGFLSRLLGAAGALLGLTPTAPVTCRGASAGWPIRHVVGRWVDPGEVLRYEVFWPGPRRSYP